MYTPGTSLLCFVIQGAFETDGNLCVTSFENVLSDWTRLQGGTALDCVLRTTSLRPLYQVRQYSRGPQALCCLSLPNSIIQTQLLC